jgi:uncharacterized membrane protein
MDLSHSRKAQQPSWMRIFFFLALLFLAYEAVDTGVHGLRYFFNYSEFKTPPRFFLLIHIAAGFIALTIGPFQFLRQLRSKYPTVHRWNGRIYAGSVFISSVVALSLAYPNPNLVFKSGIFGLGFSWLFTLSIAVIAIRKGMVQVHREWMILNYVVTFGFVTYRIGHNNMLAHGYSLQDTSIMSWLCWVPQLLCAILILYLQQRKTDLKKNKIASREMDVP